MLSCKFPVIENPFLFLKGHLAIPDIYANSLTQYELPKGAIDLSRCNILKLVTGNEISCFMLQVGNG